MKIIKILLIISLFKKCENLKILIVQTSLTKSHTLPLFILAKALVQERHHHVTFVTPFPSNKNITNLREIVTSYDDADKEAINKIAECTKDKTFIEIGFSLSKVITKIGNDTLQMTEMKALMKNEKFDLIILSYHMNEFMLGLGDHFKCPTIIFSPSSIIGNLERIIGNPFSLTGSNHYILNGQKLDFVGRLKNFLLYTYDYLIIRNIFDFYGKKTYE